MSTEAERFTAAFNAVLARNPDKAPGPTEINQELGKHKNEKYRSPMNILNGRMAALRITLLEDAGFVKQSRLGRWVKPGTGARK